MRKWLPAVLCLLLSCFCDMTARSQESIHIVHIGDSHLQSGYMAAAIRKELAKEQPIIGMGLLTPYRLAGTNAPDYYQITSNVRWKACKISYTQSCPATPPGGLSIAYSGTHFTLHIRSTAIPFDQILVFRGKAAPSLTAKGATLQIGQKEVSGFVVDTILLPRALSSITLHPAQGAASRALYGNFLLSQRNVKGGLLYSPIALNGAMYAVYDQPGFINAFARLHPDIVVLSLGTNESLAKRFNKEAFKSEVDHFIHSIQTTLPPRCHILLVSPPPSIRKDGKVNPNIRLVREALAEEAKLLQIDYYDLFQSMEQDRSAIDRYKEGNFYARDGIHFSIHGYQVIGAYVGHAIAALLTQ